MTIAQLLVAAEHKLSNTSDSAKLDSQVLLCHVLKKTPVYLYTWPDNHISSSEFEAFSCLVNERSNGMPIAYLVGEKEFWSLPLKVAPSTLIPRPDTELLIEFILNEFSNHSLNVLDLGTGTGAIALALASERNTWKVDAVDFSVDAVKLATENVANLGFQQQITVFQSDWFTAIQPTNQYHIIVSNPPYIDAKDVHLTQGDVKFEPLSALVAQNKGLADIEHIIKTSKSYLVNNGCLIIEHGYDQKSTVQALFKLNGFVAIETLVDYGGNHRATVARFNLC